MKIKELVGFIFSNASKMLLFFCTALGSVTRPFFCFCAEPREVFAPAFKLPLLRADNRDAAPVAVQHDVVPVDDGSALVQIAAPAEVFRTEVVRHARDLLLHPYALAVSRLKLRRIILVDREAVFRAVARDEVVRLHELVPRVNLLAAVRDDRRFFANGKAALLIRAAFTGCGIYFAGIIPCSFL